MSDNKSRDQESEEYKRLTREIAEIQNELQILLVKSSQAYQGKNSEKVQEFLTRMGFAVLARSEFAELLKDKKELREKVLASLYASALVSFYAGSTNYLKLDYD